MGTRTRKIALALVALSVVVAVAGVAVGRSLRIEFKVSELAVSSGEPVDFDMSVCSNSWLPMTTDDSKPRWRIVDRSGTTVADSSHYVFTMELKTLQWGPRSCRIVFSETWDQRTWNQPGDAREVDGILSRGDPVPVGRYRIEGTWGALEERAVEFEIAS
jgi:hypothetical protein